MALAQFSTIDSLKSEPNRVQLVGFICLLIHCYPSRCGGQRSQSVQEDDHGVDLWQAASFQNRSRPKHKKKWRRLFEVTIQSWRWYKAASYSKDAMRLGFLRSLPHSFRENFVKYFCDKRNQFDGNLNVWICSNTGGTFSPEVPQPPRNLKNALF